MVIGFGVETGISDESFTFFEGVKEKLGDKDIIKNAYEGRVYYFRPGVYFVSMKPRYPPFWLIGIPLSVGAFILTRTINLWMLPGFLICLTYLFWSPDFLFFLMRKGLRKTGYTGKIKRFSKNKAFEEALNWVK